MNSKYTWKFGLEKGHYFMVACFYYLLPVVSKKLGDQNSLFLDNFLLVLYFNILSAIESKILKCGMQINYFECIESIWIDILNLIKRNEIMNFSQYIMFVKNLVTHYQNWTFLVIQT